MTDVLRIELNDLSPKAENPWAGGLCKPTLATDAATRVLQSAVGNQDTVNVALQCYYSPGAFCAAHDVVLLQLGDERRVGKIKFFFETDNISYAAVTLWEGVGQNLFNPTGGPTAVCEVACILDTCAYAWRGSYTYRVGYLPVEFMYRRILSEPRCYCTQWLVLLRIAFSHELWKRYGKIQHCK